MISSRMMGEEEGLDFGLVSAVAGRLIGGAWGLVAGWISRRALVDVSACRSDHRGDRINITVGIVNRAPNYLFVQGITLLEPAAFELNEDRGGPLWIVGEDLESRPKRTGRSLPLDTEAYCW